MKRASAVLVVLFIPLLFLVPACKKKNDAGAFTYEGKWTVNYNYTTGTKVKGVFTATLKSNGKWDYQEGTQSRADAGTWTASGNSINFVFNFSGLASYTGTRASDNSLSGNAVADGGTSVGTWTATK